MRLWWRRLGGSTTIRAGLIILGLLLVLAVTLGSDPGSLPARDWNPHALSLLKAHPPKALAFAVFGDSQGGKPVFGELLRRVEQDRQIAFAILLGDLVQRGELSQYRDFFQQVRQNLTKPLLTVMGNHDLNKGSRRLYEDIFGPTYYAFQINDNYFIVVDDASPEALDHRQLSWLEQELQKARAYPRRFVFLHIPLFDPRGEKHDHCLPAESGRKLASLFQKYRVTHIFTGHIHAYFSGQWSGVPFTITGGAGGKIKHPDQEHYFFHYVKVSIRGDQVRLEVQRLPGFYPGKF